MRKDARERLANCGELSSPAGAGAPLGGWQDVLKTKRLAY